MTQTLSSSRRAEWRTKISQGFSKVGHGAASLAMCVLCAPVYLIVIIMSYERAEPPERPEVIDRSFFDYEYFKNLETQPAHYLPRLGHIEVLDACSQSVIGFNSQPHSTFLSRLPLELRLMIYKYALGGSLLHLDLSSRTHEQNALSGRELKCYPCTLNEPLAKEFWSHDCWYPRDRKETEKVPGADKHLALPLTCRLVYSEAIKYLYSENTFHFRNPACLRHLPSYILPERIDRIRSLKLCVSIDDDPTLYEKVQKHYEEVWEQIRKLKGLRELLVDLRAPESFLRAPKIDRYKDFVFGPVRKIENLGRFEMFLPIRRLDIPDDLDTGLCQLRGWDERLRAF